MDRADHYIFALWFLSSSFFLFSSPNLSGRRLDVYHNWGGIVKRLLIAYFIGNVSTKNKNYRNPLGRFFDCDMVHKLHNHSLWPPYGIGQAIIFLSCGFFFYLSYSRPRIAPVIAEDCYILVVLSFKYFFRPPIFRPPGPIFAKLCHTTRYVLK